MMRKQGKHEAPRQSKLKRSAPVVNKKQAEPEVPARVENKAVDKESAAASKIGYFVRLREQIRQGSFWLWLGVGAVLTAALGVMPMFSLYLNNLGGGLALKSVLGPAGTMVLLYLAAYLALTVITLRPSYSALLSGAVMSFLMNFGKISSVFRKGMSTGMANILALVVGAVLIVLLWWLLRRMKKNDDLIRIFSGVLTLVLCLMLVMNTFTARNALKRDLAKMQAAAQEQAIAEQAVLETQKKQKEEEDAAAKAAAEAAALAAAQEEERRLAQEKLLKESLSYGQPNLYIFMMDEMAGFDEMEKYYEYDASEFKAFCDAYNINYSSSSHSMHIRTKLCMTDFVHYTDNYATDNGVVNGTINEHTFLHQSLKKLGFSLYNMSTSAYIFQGVPALMGSLVSATEGATEDGLTAEDIAYENSVLQILLNARKPYESTAGDKLLTTEEIHNSDEFLLHTPLDYKGKITQLLRIYDFFEDPKNYVPNAGAAIFTYMKTTHVPMLFQADGSIITEQENLRNWRDIEVYNGTYTFALRHLEKLLMTVMEADPDAIVLVMGDHGVRYHNDTVLCQEFEIPMEYQTNIFNLLYYRGHKLDIEGLSATDTVRVVLNLLGEELPLQGEKNMDDVILYE